MKMQKHKSHERAISIQMSDQSDEDIQRTNMGQYIQHFEEDEQNENRILKMLSTQFFELARSAGRKHPAAGGNAQSKKSQSNHTPRRLRFEKETTIRTSRHAKQRLPSKSRATTNPQMERTSPRENRQYPNLRNFPSQFR
jgi:hypothetical protein